LKNPRGGNAEKKRKVSKKKAEERKASCYAYHGGYPAKVKEPKRKRSKGTGGERIKRGKKQPTKKKNVWGRDKYGIAMRNRPQRIKQSLPGRAVKRSTKPEKSKRPTTANKLSPKGEKKRRGGGGQKVRGGGAPLKRYANGNSRGRGENEAAGRGGKENAGKEGGEFDSKELGEERSGRRKKKTGKVFFSQPGPEGKKHREETLENERASYPKKPGGTLG